MKAAQWSDSVSDYPAWFWWILFFLLCSPAVLECEAGLNFDCIQSTNHPPYIQPHTSLQCWIILFYRVEPLVRTFKCFFPKGTILLLFLDFFKAVFILGFLVQRLAPCRVWLLPPSQDIFCLSSLFGVLLELFVLGF